MTVAESQLEAELVADAVFGKAAARSGLGRTLRHATRLSLADVAQIRTGLPVDGTIRRTSIGAWEAGRTSPTGLRAAWYGLVVKALQTLIDDWLSIQVEVDLAGALDERMNAFRGAIRAKRIRLGLSQQWVVDECARKGVPVGHQTTLQKIEAGKSNVSLRQALALCAVLDLSMDEACAQRAKTGT